MSVAAPGARDVEPPEVPLWRLHLLRAAYLLFIVPAFWGPLPHLVHPDLSGRGMITCMLGGMFVIALLGLRQPLRMLPFLLFEFVWKTIWAIDFGLPKWLAGVADPQFREDIWLIGGGPLLFGLVIPWGHVWRRYLKPPAERWR